ncbi:MAG: hypothetical protein HDQ99_15920 [Lachnospiraceae bacterium]|nr:hypothetical protein [Lachnospiraceae bacterium]
MDISTQLQLSTDRFFQELDETKEAINASWSYITNTLDTSLKTQDVKALLNLIPYIEQGEGAQAYEHIGESRRILRILHIIQLELAYQKTPFFLRCVDKDSLMEKYMLSLFALRRLFFQLSEDSIEEAADRLLHNQLSVFAVYVMTQEDLINADSALYDKIIEICSAYWNADDKQLFLSLTAKS